MAESDAKHEETKEALTEFGAGIGAEAFAKGLLTPAGTAAAGAGAAAEGAGAAGAAGGAAAGVGAASVAGGLIVAAAGGAIIGDSMDKATHGAISDGIAAGMHWLVDNPATDMKVADQVTAGHPVDAAGTYLSGVVDHMGKLLDSVGISPNHLLAGTDSGAQGPHSDAAQASIPGDAAHQAHSLAGADSGAQAPHPDDGSQQAHHLAGADSGAQAGHSDAAHSDAAQAGHSDSPHVQAHADMYDPGQHDFG